MHGATNSLNQFVDRGWLVLHGYKKDRGGDIDPVLCGPNGAYVVETKSYGFRGRDVRQAGLNAWWLRQKLGVPSVTGVLCVDEERVGAENSGCGVCVVAV